MNEKILADRYKLIEQIGMGGMGSMGGQPGQMPSGSFDPGSAPTPPSGDFRPGNKQ